MKSEPHECAACQGTGKVRVLGSTLGRRYVTCSDCWGTGVVWISVPPAWASRLSQNTEGAKEAP